VADRYRRFNLSDRLEHVAQLTAFTALAVTGLVQRYSEAWLSRRLIDLLGGIEAVRIIHRIFATILMVAVVYHLGAIGYRKFVQRRPREMLPTSADIRAAAHSMRYLAGREAAPPLQGRFTWEEKVEYFALVWGTFVMIVSGFLLWNPIATSRLLPGQFVPAAKVFHSGEALLAVLAVIVWHMYHVHIRRFNTSMFTGYMSRRDMAHEHALELEAIEAGTAFTPPTDAASRRRAKIYLPAITGVAAILLGGIYLFVTFENTAIATIDPPEQVAIYAPVETSGTTVVTTTVPGATTSTTTTTPAGAWEDTIGAIFRTQRCTDCHGNAMALGGVDLATYAGALAAVVPGDPDQSPLIVLQEKGAHPTVLDDGQLAQVRAWIAAGALEALGGTPPTGVPGGAPGWQDPISGLLASCGSCHGAVNPAAGLDLTSYESALAVITPGDPDASRLYMVQAAGGHPGQLSEADLAVLREWIAAGAP
jgi:formate dehydrogenase gamma subunit